MRSLTFLFILALVGCDKDGLIPVGDGNGSGQAKSLDADGDGHNDSAYGGDDCDDTDSAIYPGALELCDMIDNDCDDDIDDDDLNNVGRWWGADYDGDLYVDSLGTVTVCDIDSLDGVAEKLGADPDLLDDWIEVPTYQYGADGSLAYPDCNDAEASVHPGATETCNGVDDDCDSATADGPTTTWYADTDTDGYGDASSTTTSCASTMSGYVSNDDDCDDTDVDVNPAATEMCDSVDNDCDGSTDEASAADATTFYVDSDGDTYGNASSSTMSCASTMSGYVTNSTDCNDSDSAVNPGAAEVCDSADNDCDGSTDEGPGAPTTWYRDSDGDTYGDSSRSFSSCWAPSNYVGNSTDCDDTDVDVNPGATEVSNGYDDDCDGATDEYVSCALEVYVNNNQGDANSVTVDATDNAFDGNWWDSTTSMSSVADIVATETSLGGVYREYEFLGDMCFVAGTTTLALTGTFVMGEDLCEVGGNGAVVDAYEDGIALTVTEYDYDSNGDTVLDACYYVVSK